jgi:dihydrofolate synthase/folylpolyglutamate synthase
MEALLAELGNPERDFKVIHIAGTNGKGSTAVMIASILEEAGYSVGLFMSPHLEDECERVQIWDGVHRYIEKEELTSLKEYVKNTLHHEKSADVKNTLHKDYGNLTVFEVYTAAAYLYFKEQAPDYIVLETGLGGRLDSTNTIEKPLACVITQVGLDHTKELGRMVEQIAHEKAGIIKPGVPIVSESTDERAVKVLRTEAEEKGAPFIDASGLGDKYKDYELAMTGAHQIRNAAAAVETIKAAGIEVSEEAIENGLAVAHLPGRIELLGENPYWIIDGAHNPDAIDALIHTYNEFADTHLCDGRADDKSKSDAGTNPLKRTLVIFGCMQDKNLSRMIQLLLEGLKDCEYASCAVDYSRAEDPALIADKLRAAGASCKAFDSVRAAYEHAKGSDYECILVTGSIYLAGEIRSLYMHDIRTTK